MKIDDSLKTRSEFLEANRRSIGGAGRYEFGPYKILSPKKGITTTKTKSKLFSRISESESKQKSSFIFIAYATDSLIVNILETTLTTTEKSRGSVTLHDGKVTVEPTDDPKVTTANNFTALISGANDTSEWQIGYHFLEDSAKEKRYIQSLTDGKTIIEIKEVHDAQDGKFSAIWMYRGYEFLLNGKAIAAVQTLAKHYVWLRTDLDKRLKLMLAAASAVMLFHDL